MQAVLMMDLKINNIKRNISNFFAIMIVIVLCYVIFYRYYLKKYTILSITTPLTVKLLAKKFAFSEKRIMFVMKLEMTVTSVILSFKT
jgi:hypothetical protein